MARAGWRLGRRRGDLRMIVRWGIRRLMAKGDVVLRYLLEEQSAKSLALAGKKP